MLVGEQEAGLSMEILFLFLTFVFNPQIGSEGAFRFVHSFDIYLTLSRSMPYLRH